MIRRKETLRNFQLAAQREIYLADGSIKLSEAIGEVKFKSEGIADVKMFKSTKVLYVPDLTDSLLICYNFIYCFVC